MVKIVTPYQPGPSDRKCQILITARCESKMAAKVVRLKLNTNNPTVTAEVKGSRYVSTPCSNFVMIRYGRKYKLRPTEFKTRTNNYHQGKLAFP